MTQPSGPDIVVKGERQSDGTINFTVFRTNSPPMGVRYVSPRTVSENPEEPTLQIVVGIEKTDPNSNEAKMIEAAQLFIAAIERAVRLLEAESRTRVISVLGIAVSVGTLLDEIMRTDFQVTDLLDLGNGGAGAAERSPIGQNRNKVNYLAIIGGHPQFSGYANHPAYTNGEGMLALVLHEAIHMTPEGYQFYVDSLQLWRQRGGTNASFFSSVFGINLERFVNSLTLMFLTALSVGHSSQYPPVNDTNAPVGPQSVP